MRNRYKIVISNKNVYKEIELSPEAKYLKLGTGVDCDVRLRKNLFFGQIELVFERSGDSWSVRCSDNLYLTVGDIRKLMTMELSHGDLVEVKYFESDNSVFYIDFMIDFDDGKIRYERVIDTSYQPEISIGHSPSSDIMIASGYIHDDQIILRKRAEDYVLKIINSSYGVYHNGKRAESGQIIKNGDFFSLSDFFFCMKDGRVWTQIREGISVRSLRFTDRPVQNGYPKFNRSTRVKSVLNTEEIEVLDPPSKPEKPKGNIIQRLLPSMGMLIAAFFMASRGGGGMIALSAISGVMSIVTAVIGLIDGKKEYKRKSAERIETYNDYIDRKRLQIESCRIQELDDLNELYISQSREIENFDSFSSRLFDRRKEDDDFLCVRVGTGEVEARRRINYRKQETLLEGDDLQRLPGQLWKEYRYIDNAPIAFNLKTANAVGVVGQEQLRFDILKNFVIDIIARQFHTDVQLVFVAAPEHKERVHAFRLLPHVWCDTLASRTVVTDDESKNLVFEYLYKELTAREQKAGGDTHIVAFFYDECGFKNHPISRFVDKASELGISFVFFEEQAEDVPMGCTKIIDVIDAHNASLIDTSDRSKTIELEYPRISEQETQDIIDIMAPVYTEELSLEGSLTRNISLFELLNIIAVDDIDLGRRWGNSNVTRSMAAPLGVTKSGVIELDLHDKAHGPHGLVAGTTGSGKSEILQTYILSMATLFHPYEVGFVIIDFKGGGMVNQFRELPHLMGAITNIDGKEIDRSLKSIKAELQKRQRCFAEAEVNHIDKYIAKFKKGEVKEPLPHLIIIVDEFAELKAEQPEFMKELISAARIGRSLGVHLILATQKPSGQVNEQIWSNSRFKLCLKVQSQADSNEVIKSPLAAEIKEPGRAYLQVGNNEIFELFQSAYSGAPEKMEDSNIKEFSIIKISDSGKRQPVYTQKKSASSGSITQLEAIVSYVSKFCLKNQVEKLPDICLPPLPSVVDMPVVMSNYSLSALPVGIYDDPDNQYQGCVPLNIAEENVFVAGSVQTGKTNFLQTVIRAVTSKYSPEEVNIYIADLGSMYLVNYEQLKHVGGIVTLSENEKFKNLFKLLQAEITKRKETFQRCGLSSYSSYLEAGYKDIPHIIFMLENFSAFKEIFSDAHEEQLLYVLREGPACGITTIITNTSTSGVSYKYMSNLAARIAFNCNDTNEYGNIFDRCRMAPAEMPGRMLCRINKQVYEAQCFLAFKGEKEIERSAAVKEYVDKINALYPDMQAKVIPCVPERLTADYLRQNYANPTGRGKYHIGMDYTNVDAVLLDLGKYTELCIVGKEAARKRAITQSLLSTLSRSYLEKHVKLYIVDSVERPYKAFSANSFVEQYTIDYSEIDNIIESVYSELETRYEILMAGETAVLEKCEQIVVIVDNNAAIEYISQNKELYKQYSKIIKDFGPVGISFWFTNIENASVAYGAPELLKKLKDNKRLITGSLQDFKFCDIPMNAARNNRLVNAGDVFLVDESEITRLKLTEVD